TRDDLCISSSTSTTQSFTPPIPYPFFLLQQRPPPTSPLFPYTTLFRSRLPGRLHHRRPAALGRRGAAAPDAADPAGSVKPKPPRSEEHTSELQSQSNLVCRLLLEKKKNSSQHVHK